MQHAKPPQLGKLRNQILIECIGIWPITEMTGLSFRLPLLGVKRAKRAKFRQWVGWIADDALLDVKCLLQKIKPAPIVLSGASLKARHVCVEAIGQVKAGMYADLCVTGEDDRSATDGGDSSQGRK